ncbi:MAG TPA: hypothetical protein ENN25_04040 [Euryarchaeota archaeon]|nr:hypothetical protein [Euryarchaeota archaeon]
MTSITDADRLDRLEKIIDELAERSRVEVIVVEGMRDIEALRKLAVFGNIRSLQVGNSVMNFCEHLSKEYERFIIMTDWDRKGGQFAHLLRKAIESCGARYDDSLRANIARLTKKSVKDVQGLPGFIESLQKAVERNAFAKRSLRRTNRKY